MRAITASIPSGFTWPAGLSAGCVPGCPAQTVSLELAAGRDDRSGQPGSVPPARLHLQSGEQLRSRRRSRRSARLVCQHGSQLVCADRRATRPHGTRDDGRRRARAASCGSGPPGTGPRGGEFSNGTIRFYLDGNPEPVIEGPIASIIDGGGLVDGTLSRRRFAADRVSSSRS